MPSVSADGEGSKGHHWNECKILPGYEAQDVSRNELQGVGIAMN